MGHKIIKMTTNQTMSIHVIVVPKQRIGSSNRRLRFTYLPIPTLKESETGIGAAGSETSDI